MTQLICRSHTDIRLIFKPKRRMRSLSRLRRFAATHSAADVGFKFPRHPNTFKNDCNAPKQTENNERAD